MKKQEPHLSSRQTDGCFSVEESEKNLPSRPPPLSVNNVFLWNSNPTLSQQAQSQQENDMMDEGREEQSEQSRRRKDKDINNAIQQFSVNSVRLPLPAHTRICRFNCNYLKHVPSPHLISIILIQSVFLYLSVTPAQLTTVLCKTFHLLLSIKAAFRHALWCMGEGKCLRQLHQTFSSSLVKSLENIWVRPCENTTGNSEGCEPGKIILWRKRSAIYCMWRMLIFLKE